MIKFVLLDILCGFLLGIYWGVYGVSAPLVVVFTIYCGISIYGGATGESNLFFADEVGGAIGYINYLHNDDTLHIFVNHWSSRRGGEEESEPKRLYAAQLLKDSSEDSCAVLSHFCNAAAM